MIFSRLGLSKDEDGDRLAACVVRLEEALESLQPPIYELSLSAHRYLIAASKLIATPSRERPKKLLKVLVRAMDALIAVILYVDKKREERVPR